MTQLSKPEKYIKLAKYNADLFSKDPNTKVGCILLTPDFSRVLSTGINGFPRNIKDNIPERWERPEKYIRVCHAECNSIANAARTGTPIDGAVAVVTLFPCSNCAKMMIQSGISKVYSIEPDFTLPIWSKEFEISQELFTEAGIEIVTFDKNILK